MSFLFLLSVKAFPILTKIKTFFTIWMFSSKLEANLIVFYDLIFAKNHFCMAGCLFVNFLFLRNLSNLDVFQYIFLFLEMGAFQND